jgi:CheY-like chemotaxis protein
MHTIILASPRVDQWQAFGEALGAGAQADIVYARSGEQALEAARKLNPLVVALDADLGDYSGTELVRRLMGVNAMIYTALSSDEPEEIFHEHTEGLGILMKLSPQPTPAEADRLAQCLRQVTGAV